MVLDVGCGSGAMALLAAPAARRLVGVDISEPLIAVAVDRARRERFTNVEFVIADAQTHVFDEAFVHVLISQFGLTFFDDPVTAFSNLRRAMVPGGRIVFAGWRALGDNEWLAPVVAAIAEFTGVPDLAVSRRAVGCSPSGSVETVDLLDRGRVRPGGQSSRSRRWWCWAGAVTSTRLRRSCSAWGSSARFSAVSTTTSASERPPGSRAQLQHRYEPGVGVPLGSAVWLAPPVPTGFRIDR